MEFCYTVLAQCEINEFKLAIDQQVIKFKQ